MRFLIVDDEPFVGKALRRLLVARGHTVELAENGPGALAVLERTPIDIVLCDYRMPGMTGGDVLRVVKERWPGVRRVLMSGYMDSTTDPGAGVSDHFLAKPWTMETFGELLARLEG